MLLNAVVETGGDEGFESITADVGVLVGVVYGLEGRLAHYKHK